MNKLILIAIFAFSGAIVIFAYPKHGESMGAQNMTMQRYAMNSTKRRLRLVKLSDLAKMNQMSSSTDQLTDYNDFMYIIPITVGTPGVSFPVILDTGSSDLWLASTSCYDCYGISPLYNPQSSTTATNNNGEEVYIGYGGGSDVCVSLITDKVCIGSVCYLQQTFGQAISGVSSFPISGEGAGLLGLAWPQASQEGVNPFVQNILSQLPQPLFTIWLNSVGPFSSTGESTNGGVITFGGLDTTHCSTSINYVPVTFLYYWLFTLSGAAAGSFSQSASWQVISDTGTSLIYGPSAVVAGLATAIGATATGGGSYQIPCIGNYPPVIFTIGGVQYSIPSSIYIVDNLGGGYCQFAFVGVDYSGDSYSWILGDPFVRAVCNVYNVGTQQIGFAQSLTIGSATTTSTNPTTTSTKPTTTSTKLTTTSTNSTTTSTKPTTTSTKPTTTAATSRSCQTCPIKAMNFTWYRPEAPGDGLVDYAPQVTYSINVTTGCAQILLDCSCGGAPQEYIFAYSNGAEYNALSPAIFECNAAAQLWQYGTMTVTNFICYRQATIQCSTTSTTNLPTTTKSMNCLSGWTYFNVTNSCYLAQYNATWDNAQSYCQANGANLTSIHSLAENNFVEALPSNNVAISEAPQYSNVYLMTWIGLRAAPTTLNFVWIDGTNYDYSIWRTDTSPIQPNRVGANSGYDCAELLNVLYNNTWNQASCGQVMRSFVCKRPAIGGSAISDAELRYIIHTMF